MNPRPHLGQMDLTVRHETSSLAPAAKRGGKAVHCKSSVLMKSAWLQLLLPGRNRLEYSITVGCLASIKPGCRLILLSLYFFILYENPSISFLRIQNIFTVKHNNGHEAILICIMKMKALFRILLRVFGALSIWLFRSIVHSHHEAHVIPHLYLTKQTKKQLFLSN